LADRVVKITLQAQVANYIAGMQQAQRETNKTTKTAADAKASFEAQNQAMTQLGVGLLAMGALAAAGVGLAIKKYAEFDQAMSEVQASTHDSEANMNKLRDAAIEAGARTVFSATEAAHAIDELAKAGLSTADILGGALDGALSLASAGGLDVADAAQIAATELTQFKLEGKDVPHVADLLAAGAGKAQGSVEDLSQALNQGGLVASQAGFSIEETTGVLAAFASAGLKGSDAGTSLKTAILALESPSAKAAAVMDQYGINVYDSSGKMLSFAGIADQLKTKLGGLTDEQRNSALATIFGTDAVRSASVLYANGASGINLWNQKVNDSGYAAETARLKLNNLNGDLEQLGGSFDTALIKSGSAANDVLRGIVQTATLAVNAFGDAPPVVQGTALALGAVAAATALAGGAFLVGVPKLAQFSAGLEVLKDSTMPGVASGAARIEGGVGKAGSALTKTARFLTGPWGLALAAAAISTHFFVDELNKGATSAEEFQNNIATAATGTALLKSAVAQNGLSKNFYGDLKNELKDLPGLLQKATDADNGFGGWLNLSVGNRAAISGLSDLGKQLAVTASTDLPKAQDAFRSITDEYDLNRKQQIQLLNQMGPYRDALVQQASALGINVTSSNEAANNTNLLRLAMGDAKPPAIQAAEAYLKTSGAADETNDAVRRLIDSMNAINGKNQDAISANADYQKSLQDVKDTIADIDPETGKARTGVEAFQHTLDESTAAGSANVKMLSDLAASGQQAAQAQLDAGGTADQYTASLKANYDAVYNNALAITGNADAAKALADRVAAIPTEKQIALIVATAQANAEIDAFVTRNDGRKIRLNITGSGPGGALIPSLGNMAFASGGMVPGAPSHRDNMVATVASGEFITRTAQAQIPANRAALEYMNAGGVIRGYAGGGFVQPQYARPSYGGGYAAASSTAAPAWTGNMYVSTDDPSLAAGIVTQGLAARLRFRK